MEIFERRIGQCSANDDDGFTFSKRERSVPIRETITRITGYPSKLVVYQIAASRFWQARCWIDGKLCKRSTKQADVKMAQQKAKAFFHEWLASSEMRSSLRTMTESQIDPLDVNRIAPPKGKSAQQTPATANFDSVAKQLLVNEAGRVSRGELSKSALMVLRNRLKNLSSNFGDIPCSQIRYEKLQELVNQLSLDYSTTTIHQYLVAVRKVLRHALAMRVIDVLPDFPKIQINSQSRGAFTAHEYWRILRCARRLTGQEYPESSRVIRLKNSIRGIDKHMPPDIAWSAGFMVNAFIRPSDLRTLKHKHIQIVRGKNTYLRMTLPKTKSHSTPIVTLFPAVRIYEQIVKYQSALGKAGPEDFVFLPHITDRDYALRVLGFHLNWILEKTGLKSGPHGQPRSLYSFRHSAITFRLLYGQGIDLITLARNARTSIEVINTHYASTVTGEQNIAMLQSRRTKMHPSML
jgi:hypothetical protein